MTVKCGKCYVGGGFYMIRVRAQRTYIPWEDAGRL